jgi:hypothetical protein
MYWPVANAIALVFGFDQSFAPDIEILFVIWALATFLMVVFVGALLCLLRHSQRPLIIDRPRQYNNNNNNDAVGNSDEDDDDNNDDLSPSSPPHPRNGAIFFAPFSVVMPAKQPKSHRVCREMRNLGNDTWFPTETRLRPRQLRAST